MSATCTNGYIRRVIGVTRNFAWTILTDGEAVSLEGRDLTLVLIHPRGNKEEMEFAAVNNVVTFSWQGKDQKELGRYGIILYENYGKPNQLRVDIHKFLELIPWSDREAGSYADLTETHTDLGTNEISGEIIVVNNLTSTSTSSALSANMGRVLKEDIDALAQQMGGVTVLSTLQAVDAAAVYADIQAGKNIVLDYEGSYVLLSSYTTGQRNGTPIVDMLEFADEYFDPTDGVETVTYFVWRYSDGWEGGETALATTDQVRAKQDIIEDLSTIRSGAAAGATAYQKPSTGIPKTDLASAVQTSLGKADTSVQNKGSESNIVVGVGNSSNIGITSSSIGMETVNSAILIGNDITLNTSGSVKYNGSRVATATDLQGKQDVIRDLQTIRDGAAAGATAVQPAALQEGLAGKQDTLTFDSTPTANSNNPVTSGGIKTALDAKQATIDDLSTIRSGASAGATAVQPATLAQDIAALPDNEDIDYNSSDKLQFANKSYNAATFSGLGRVYLRKNIVDVSGTDKNVLTQAMVNTANTIYHIQYDYDLNGQTIILPVNCVLEFDGGSFSNGIITANYQMLVNASDSQIFKNVTITGYIKNELLPVVWFGVKADNSEYIDNNSRIIESLLDINVPLVFPKGNVYVRNINLDLSTALSFKLLGADATNDRVSDPSRNTTNFMNDGESFFVCFSTKTTKRNITIKNITFKCAENGYVGNFINTTSNANYTNSDISLYVYNCLFSDMDYVVKHNAYGTYLTFDNCIFKRIRTAVSFDKNCNLAKLTNLSFFGVGQCLKVYGSKCTISRIEFDCIYRGEDWETLDLFGIYTQLVCYISHIYEEIYTSHNSMYKYKLIEYNNSRSIYLYIDDMSFPFVENTEKTERLSHIHINNVTLGLPCNLATIDCKGSPDQLPYVFTSDLNMNGAEVLPYNVMYNGNTAYTKNICSGARTLPVKVENTQLAKSTITANKYAFNFTFDKSANVYGTPLTDAQKLNGAYYRDNVFNSAYSPVVDIVGVLNIDSIKDASDNELTGKFKFYIAPNNWKQNGLQAEDLVGEFSYNSSPLRITFNERRQVLGHIYYGGYYFVIQYVDGDTNYIQFTNTSKVNGTISFEVKPVQNTLVTY